MSYCRSKIILALAFIAAIMSTPALACDQALVISNWKSCAIGPLGENTGEADWNAVPAWTNNSSIRPYFHDDPRLLANHGLCNTKYHRVVLCLPAWETTNDQNACWYLICRGVAAKQIKPTLTRPVTLSDGARIAMEVDGGTFVVPVTINHAITLKFILDSGAAYVIIPIDVVTTLMRAGTIKSTDFSGEQTYRLADGSIIPGKTFRIRSLDVGGKTLEDITGSVAPLQGKLLLGQSFLRRFKS